MKIPSVAFSREIDMSSSNSLNISFVSKPMFCHNCGIIATPPNIFNIGQF